MTSSHGLDLVPAQVQFDASEAAAGGGAGGGCLLFCTEGGFLAMASPAFDDGSSAQQVLQSTSTFPASCSLDAVWYHTSS